MQRPHGQSRDIRILPVPMRVDPAEKEKADAGRDGGQAALRRAAGRTDRRRNGRLLGRVQVPYQAFYAYEETLATFGDPPGAPGTLLRPTRC